MNVISHENISEKNKTAFNPVSVQSLKVVEAVGFVKEDILSLIASDDYVVKSPLKLYARFPCHACNNPIIAEGCGDVYLWPALERKYPKASKEWIWQYVFPVERLSVDPS